MDSKNFFKRTLLYKVSQSPGDGFDKMEGVLALKSER